MLELLQPPDGGVAEHVRVLALELTARGHEIIVAGPPDAAPREELHAAGIAWIDLPILGSMVAPGSDLASLRTIADLLASRRFDLVHTHAQKAGLLGRIAALRAELPVLYTPHAFVYRTQLQRGAHGARARFVLTRGVERALGRRTAAILTVCEEERTAAIADRIAPAGRVHTVLNGVAPDQSIAADPELLSFAAGEPLLGFVSGLRDQKGLPTLLDALERVAATGPVPRVAIVGNGELEAYVEQRLLHPALVGRARRFPYRGRVEPALRAFDAFLLPSYWEGLPLALLEAMALGVAPIASAVGGVPEVICEGETGWLVPPRDVDALARRLLASGTDPGQLARVGAAAAVEARERFGIARMVDQTEAAYLRVC